MIVILENIRSAHNVGSIFRTADAVGAEGIVLVGVTPAPADKFGRPQPEIAKTALGAEKNIPWRQAKTARPVIAKLKKDGYLIIALEQSEKSKDIRRFVPPKNGKFAVVLGSETEGVSKAILSSSDEIIEIPMFGRKESLNVSVAFGIIAYASLLNK